MPPWEQYQRQATPLPPSDGPWAPFQARERPRTRQMRPVEQRLDDLHPGVRDQARRELQAQTPHEIPAESEAPMRARSTAPTEQPFLRGAWDAVTGSRRRQEGVGEVGGQVNEPARRAAIPVGVGFALERDEESRANIIRQNVPTSEFRRDDYGNLQVRLSPETPWAYVDRPGLSVQDVADFSADLVAFLPGAGLARMIGWAGRPVATVAARALAAGATGAAVEAGREGAAQPLGGTGVRLGDVAMSGVAGATGSITDDAVSAGVQVFDDLARAIPGRRNQNWTGGAQTARDTAQNLGAAETSAAAQSLTPDRDAARAAYEAADEFGIPLTRGQATGNVRARQREDNMLQGGSTEEAQRVMGGFSDRQAEAIRQGGMAIPARGQKPLTENLDDAGQVFADSMRGRRDALRQRQNQQYQRAFALAEADRVPPSDELLARVEGLIEREFLDAGPARAIIHRLHGQLAKGDATFANVERARQQLNRELSKAMSARDSASEYSVNAIINELDGWAGQVARNPDARQAMQEARGIYSEVRQLYGERARTDLSTGHVGRRDPGGSAIERVLDTDLTGQQVADAILGAGRRPPAAALGAVSRIREIATQSIKYQNRTAPSGVRVPNRRRMGNQDLDMRVQGAQRFVADDPAGPYGLQQPTEELQALREATFYRVLAPIDARREGGMVPAQTVVSNLDAALNGPGRQIMSELYTARELAAMQRFLGVLRRIERPVGVNTSGTAAAMSRMAQQAFDGLMAVVFGATNLATLGVAGGVRQANRELGAAMSANAAISRPEILIQLPRGGVGIGPEVSAAGAEATRDRDERRR